MDQFCDMCNNLFGYNVVDGKIKMECTSCHFTKDPVVSKCIKASGAFSNTSEVKLVSDMRYDNALPHTNAIKCINLECESLKNPDLTDIVYLDYNADKMLAYICTVCHSSWKNLHGKAVSTSILLNQPTSKPTGSQPSKPQPSKPQPIKPTSPPSPTSLKKNK